MNIPAAVPAHRPQSRLTRDAVQRVYFALNSKTGEVKIGFSQDVAKRLLSLATAGGCELGLIRIVPGGRPTERWFHRRFAAYRRKGEWFAYHPEMLTAVAPDEVPVVPQLVVRRDVRLTLKERVRDARSLGDEVGLTQTQILMMVSGQITEEEAAAALSFMSGDCA